MYIYSNVYKQMTDVKLWLLHSNVWNHLIIIMSHCQHGFPSPSLATSLLSIAPWRLHPVLAQICCRLLLAGHPTLDCPCEGVHWSTSLISLSLLLQLCPSYLVRQTWIHFVMSGQWLYSCCFVGCCLQDLSNTAHRARMR